MSPSPARLISDARLRELEETLGVRFRERDLLELALTHSSYLNENPDEAAESNERLEFLGDAVVDVAVARHLYGLAPAASEGELTTLRSQIVRGAALAAAALRYRIGEFLVLGRGEAISGGADRATNLADAFEAVTGALLLDRGYRAASEFVVRSLGPEIDAAIAAESTKDPKSILQERVQASGGAPPEYRIIRENEDDEDNRFIAAVLIGGATVGTGLGRRKLDAERAAALAALAAPAGRRPDE